MVRAETKKEHIFFEKSLEEPGYLELKPQKLGKIPEMAVLLGLISPKYFKIYSSCDGQKIEDIAKTLKIDPSELREHIDKLIKNRMVTL